MTAPFRTGPPFVSLLGWWLRSIAADLLFYQADNLERTVLKPVRSRYIRRTLQRKCRTHGLRCGKSTTEQNHNKVYL